MFQLRLQSWNGSEILFEYSFQEFPLFPDKVALIVDGLSYTPLSWVYDLEKKLITAKIRNHCDEYYSSLNFKREIKTDNGLCFSSYSAPEALSKSWVDEKAVAPT